MRKNSIPILHIKRCFFLAWLFIYAPAFGWSNQISVGYDFPSHESNQNYNHSGVYLNGNFYHHLSVDHMLLFTLNGAVGYWSASTDENNRLVTVALLPTFRAYFSHVTSNYMRPYLFVSYGPAYLSNKNLGNKCQGAHFVFQGDIGGGFELGKHYKGLDINLRFVHFSNAGLFYPNKGFDFLYVISIGYLW